jgi:hypothetical protein
MRARDAPHRQASRPANPMRPGAPRHAVALAPSRVHGEVRTRCVRRASSASDGMPRANAGLTSAARRCPSCHDGRGTRSQYQWNPILTTRIMRCVSFVHDPPQKHRRSICPKRRTAHLDGQEKLPSTAQCQALQPFAATLTWQQHPYYRAASIAISHPPHLRHPPRPPVSSEGTRAP